VAFIALGFLKRILRQRRGHLGGGLYLAKEVGVGS